MASQLVLFESIALYVRHETAQFFPEELGQKLNPIDRKGCN
jgi:hypothetical protein